MFVCWLYKDRLVKISEKCNSKRNKAFVSSLQDAHLGPMKQLKTDVVLYIVREKVNKLLVFTDMIVMPRYIKKDKTDYNIEI